MVVRCRSGCCLSVPPSLCLRPSSNYVIDSIYKLTLGVGSVDFTVSLYTLSIGGSLLNVHLAVGQLNNYSVGCVHWKAINNNIGLLAFLTYWSNRGEMAVKITAALVVSAWPRWLCYKCEGSVWNSLTTRCSRCLQLDRGRWLISKSVKYLIDKIEIIV